MMPLPRPTEEHHRLRAFEGDWEGEEKLHPSSWGPGGVALGRSRSRLDMDGLFVLQDYVQERDGEIVFRGHGVLGWEPETKSYVWFWVDSMGFIPKEPARGRWDGDALVLHSTNPRGLTRYTFRFPADSVEEFTIEASADGGQTWKTSIEATYRRK
ncbi:MAG TPA: DUF1579 family protein [Haliangiales bacterium]|nr:DUF1579 family protein [Haliangiales bacterium]